MGPRRIVVLGAELPDIFLRLGALDRVVGISAFTEGPPEALALPKVAGFQHGRARRILSVRPDLVILTTSVQQALAAELHRHRVPILHLYPHRLTDLFHTVEVIGEVVGRRDEARRFVDAGKERLARFAALTRHLPRPRVYFEEWMDPLVTGIGWVSDAIELAGGTDVFRDRGVGGRTAKERTVSPEEVVERHPDIILASWCGKPFEPARLLTRPGFDGIPAVQRGQVLEWPARILQCGPALLDEIPRLYRLFHPDKPSPDD